MIKKAIILCIAVAFGINATAQLFIDDGTNGIVSIRNTSNGILGRAEASPSDVAIYVDGNITIEGIYDNQGAEVQLSGDISNTGTFTTTGDEVFIGGASQTISGTFTASHDFYNLIISKTSSTPIVLNANVEIDSAGVLAFEGGVFVTEDNYVYVKDTLVASITGAETNGALDKFIEGELRRNIAAGYTYDFPIGGTYADTTGGDGIQYASLKSNDGNGVVSVQFSDSTGIGILDNIVICSTGSGNQQNIEYRIRNGSWKITNPGGGINNYDITLNPTDYTDIGYVDYTILKDGLPTGRDACDGIASLPPLTHDSFWGPLAYVLIGGVTVGTMITLLFVPALYALWFRLKEGA